MINLHKRPEKHGFDRVALLLQGGGALGSYQAGVYQALAEAGVEPDWVARTRRQSVDRPQPSWEHSSRALSIWISVGWEDMPASNGFY
jgi:hypothetical protein